MEVKRRARFAVLRHLEQASEDTDGRPPVVWLREDGNRRWAVLLWADDWSARRAAARRGCVKRE